MTHMFKILLSLSLLLTLLMPVSAQLRADEFETSWLVVVNESSGLTELSQKQVMSLFLGRAQFLPDGTRVKTFDFPVDSATRAGFYQRLTGKNIADIDAYWARLRYSGRASPPQVLADGDAIIQRVSEQGAALAYLPAQFKDTLAANGLRAVLTMRNP